MTARVLLRLENLSRLPDRHDAAGGPAAVRAGQPAPAGAGAAGRRHAPARSPTRVRADVRGRFEVGPLVVRLTDPFGLCELTRSFPTVDHLIVIPQVVAAADDAARR